MGFLESFRVRNIGALNINIRKGFWGYVVL